MRDERGWIAGGKRWPCAPKRDVRMLQEMRNVNRNIDVLDYVLDGSSFSCSDAAYGHLSCRIDTTDYRSPGKQEYRQE